MATTRRTQEDLRTAWHCCLAGPDISTTVPGPAPTTAGLYGLEAAEPTSQRDLESRRENRQSDPSGVGPGKSAEPAPGAHAPLIKMRWGVATVIARQAVGLLPRPHDQACVIRSTTTVSSSRQVPPAADTGCRLRTRLVGGPQRSAEKTEARGTDGWARVQPDYHCTPRG